MSSLLGSGRKQHGRNSLEDQVNHDASYQRTVKGQDPDDPDKDDLTLQGTIGTPGCQHLSCHQQCRVHAIRESPAIHV